MSSAVRDFTGEGLPSHKFEEAINREIEWLERAIALLPIWLRKVPIQFPFKSFLITNPYMVSPAMSMPPISMLKRHTVNTILWLGSDRIRQLQHYVN
jgi:hypothetical protein